MARFPRDVTHFFGAGRQSEISPEHQNDDKRHVWAVDACAGRARPSGSYRPTPVGIRLFPFSGADCRLPSSGLLTWSRSDGLDLLFFGLFGFPIASLLAFSHVYLP